MVVIPKPNKSAYDSPKLYQPIILLNTIGKLFKKWLENNYNSILSQTTSFIKVSLEVLDKGLLQIPVLFSLILFVQDGLRILSQAP